MVFMLKLLYDQMMIETYQMPGRAQSLWLASIPDTNYDSLSENLRVDVAVLGGGIAGITTALLLNPWALVYDPARLE